MERRRSTRDRSRGPNAKPPPEQLPGKKKKPAAKKITTNVKDNSPLDATGDDGGKLVDATGDDVEKQVDATGRGSTRKNVIFQIASGPILSIPIYLKTCFYGPCKFSLKKNDQNLPAGHVKVLIFCRSSR